MSGPDNIRRLDEGGTGRQMEGMPLLHLRSHREASGHPGWAEWFAAFGQRETGPDRGVHYASARLALDAVRQNVGFLVCGLSLILHELEDGQIVLPFPLSNHLVAPHPYRLVTRPVAARRPQVERFAGWLIEEARGTRRRIEALAGPQASPKT